MVLVLVAGVSTLLTSLVAGLCGAGLLLPVYTVLAGCSVPVLAVAR